MSHTTHTRLTRTAVVLLALATPLIGATAPAQADDEGQIAKEIRSIYRLGNEIGTEIYWTVKPFVDDYNWNNGDYGDFR